MNEWTNERSWWQSGQEDVPNGICIQFNWCFSTLQLNTSRFFQFSSHLFFMFQQSCFCCFPFSNKRDNRENTGELYKCFPFTFSLCFSLFEVEKTLFSTVSVWVDATFQEDLHLFSIQPAVCWSGRESIKSEVIC